MKIAIDFRLCKYPVTGIGRYTLEIIFNIINSGDTYYIYSVFPLDSYDKRDIDRIRKSPNVIFRTFPCKGNVCALIWSQTVVIYWALKDKVDVLWTPTIRLPLLLLGKVHKVITIHDMVFKYAPQTMKPYKGFVNTIITLLVIKLTKKILVVSNSTADDVIRNYPKYKDKVKVTNLGPKNFGEALAFSTLKDLNITKPYFLFVGTLEPRKNLRRLLYAYASLSESVRDKTSLVITGCVGWGRQQIPELVKMLNIKNNVVITGYIDNKIMATLYKHAEFLALVSIYEGFGLPIIEANYYGTPVLTSNISSMPEVSKKAGLLINPFDINSITLGLESLLTNKKLLANLASFAKQNASRFSWKQTSSETLKAFRECEDN